MEAAGLALGVIGLLSLVGDIRVILVSVANAPQECAQLQEEMETLKVVLTGMDKLNSLSGETKKLLLSSNGPIVKLTTILRDMQPKFKGHKKVLGRLIWPFKLKEAELILMEISRQKQNILLALTNDSM